MALRKIITEENEILRKKSKVVTKFDESLWFLLDDMKETLIKAQGAGLAAPQVAVLKRAFIVMANNN
ncbi:MAG: peptide deformylase, partial [Clostridia bacterium]|nr:peptide deformylase [Clostridia bacterium]